MYLGKPNFEIINKCLFLVSQACRGKHTDNIDAPYFHTELALPRPPHDPDFLLLYSTVESKYSLYPHEKKIIFLNHFFLSLLL